MLREIVSMLQLLQQVAAPKGAEADGTEGKRVLLLPLITRQPPPPLPVSEDSHIRGEDAVDEVLLGQVEGALQLVVVEGDLARARAVEPGLHEGGPRVLQEEAPADVVLADPRHAGIHRLAAVVLHRVLPQEEEGEEADVVGRDEVGLCGREGEAR